MKKIIQKSIYVGVLVFIFSGIISCEKDFTNIGTSIINNTQFSTDVELVAIEIENSPVENVQSDNISIEPGQYLLGVHASPDYEKIEASIISQITISTGLTLVDNAYGADTTVVSTIDTVFLKLPYQATLTENTSSGPEYELDSIIGDVATAFTLNVYQSDTYLSRLNPSDPSKINSYLSDDPYQKIGSELNSEVNYPFTPNKNDTMMVVKRWLSDASLYAKDTIKYNTTATSDIPVPFARIPLDEATFKTLFLDKYESPEFETQEAFNDYFRGIILEATGNEGSLISFDFNNTIAQLNPSIEVYYTNTVLKAGTTIIDTIKKNTTFSLAGIRRNPFKMTDRVYPANEEVKVQGAAGSEATITLFDAAKLAELRTKNWLINDASLTFYINQDADTTSVPSRMYLYKNELINSQTVLGQIKDSYSESVFFGGFLERDNGKKDRYTFRITDYISDLLSGETNYNPALRLKVFNPTDLPVSDTVFRPYNWNPKAVTLLNHSPLNGTRKAQLKISYSEKRN
ncbi:MAG: DUF4270 domain-containing protein [Polaribacter sp.]